MPKIQKQLTIDYDLVEKIKTQIDPRGFSKLTESLLEAWYDHTILRNDNNSKADLKKLEEEEKKTISKLTEIKRDIEKKKAIAKEEQEKQKKEESNVIYRYDSNDPDKSVNNLNLLYNKKKQGAFKK